jgi:serine O-acetyltransferase
MSDATTLEQQQLNTPRGLWAQWRSDIACVFERDPAARTRWEVLTTYPGVHAVMTHRLSHRLWRNQWRYPARFLSYLTRLFTNIDIHPGAVIGERFFIDHGAGVVIGETAVVGNDVTLYHGVTLGGTSWSAGKRHPTLGNNVLIGAGAKVLGPVTLGDGVRVGANSVVIGDVPANRTVVGVPGRMVNSGSSQRNPYGIDLNHHLIPDPLGRAITCLMERIEQLERQLQNQQQPCGECQSDAQCPERVFAVRAPAQTVTVTHAVHITHQHNEQE